MAIGTDDLAGGPSYYNPTLGLLAIRNPERLAMVLAANGHPVPDDAPPNVKPTDAHRSLGEAIGPASQGLEPMGAPDRPRLTTTPRGGIDDAARTLEPAPISPTKGDSRIEGEPAPSAAPGAPPPQSWETDPTWAAARGAAAINPNAGVQSTLRPDPEVGQGGPGPASSPDVAGQLVDWLEGKLTPSANAALPPPVQGVTPTAAPEPTGEPALTPREASGGVRGTLPTPAPEAAAATGAAPEPSFQARPGDLNKPEPKPGDGKSSGVDSLAKAMAGLSAMKPTVPTVHTPGIPHVSNQLSRSNLPQALMAEILGATKPTSQFRLGEALRGRAYA